MNLRRKISKFRGTIEDIAESLIIVLIIRTFIIQTSIVPTGSMKNTIFPGDCLLVSKFKYIFTLPKRNDIVVFKFPQDPTKDFIKRVIGLPGDKIEIIKKQVFVNDNLLNEPYKVIERNNFIPKELNIPRDYYGPVIIPFNSLFVMGDNRDNSNDSRFWGFVDIKFLKGKPLVRIWPLNRLGLVK